MLRLHGNVSKFYLSVFKKIILPYIWLWFWPWSWGCSNVCKKSPRGVGVKAILTRLPGSSPILDFIAFLLTSFFLNLPERVLFHPPVCIYVDDKRLWKKEIEKKVSKLNLFVIWMLVYKYFESFWLIWNWNFIGYS